MYVCDLFSADVHLIAVDWKSLVLFDYILVYFWFFKKYVR
jgi:hypothetical protein